MGGYINLVLYSAVYVNPTCCKLQKIHNKIYFKTMKQIRRKICLKPEQSRNTE